MRKKSAQLIERVVPELLAALLLTIGGSQTPEVARHLLRRDFMNPWIVRRLGKSFDASLQCSIGPGPESIATCLIAAKLLALSSFLNWRRQCHTALDVSSGWAMASRKIQSAFKPPVAASGRQVVRALRNRGAERRGRNIGSRGLRSLVPERRIDRQGGCFHRAGGEETRAR